ncbi:DUF5675 family protein [Flavobacterium orientale]|uniref:DUF5675 domain-containing protein n=1 Tax=Flavobacterium orientale TaxID=1756020 RepID=A0A916Y9M4_9FLAO|nr:DUF5675 family protein [Flavobacterium orientale]GGD35401.1 hypothetical protein GCM10011343_26590 [Flavobacterium orientale]
MILTLKRTYFPKGVNGKLTCDGQLVCYTIELPWNDNARQVSCIPEGEYFIEKRYSSKYRWHMEVKGVPNRDYILFHAANHALTELKGCIAPVLTLSGPGEGLYSRRAFNQLKALVYAAIERGERVVVTITS